MWNKVVKYRLSVLLGAMLGLSACASDGTSDRPRPPNYASMISTDRWEVSCGRNKIVIDGQSLHQFYKADGSAYSYIEFCEEYGSGTRINPRR